MTFKGRIQLRPRRLRINITWNISTIGNFDVQNVVYYNAKFLSISELFVSPRAYKPQTAKKFLKRISNIREEHGFRVSTRFASEEYRDATNILWWEKLK